MLRFRQMKSLQKFASVHASISNHFQSQRHLVDRQTYKTLRSAALAEWAEPCRLTEAFCRRVASGGDEFASD